MPVPGGHFVHPCVPLEEEFENVPKGHGRNLSNDMSFSGICRNPEAKRAAIKALLLEVSGSYTSIASASESRGFLGQSNDTLYIKTEIATFYSYCDSKNSSFLLLTDTGGIKPLILYMQLE